MIDKTENEMLRAVEQALGSLSQPFYFETELKTGTYFSNKRRLSDEFEILTTMKGAHDYCDSLGFRYVMLGHVSLAIVVLAEGFSRDEIIGRSILIKNSVDPFGKLSRKNTWNKQIHANVFYIFDTSEKAFGFRDAIQSMCKHTRITFLRTVMVKPWGIDFHGKHVAGPKGLLSGLNDEPSEIESKLFGGR